MGSANSGEAPKRCDVGLLRGAEVGAFSGFAMRYDV